MRNRCNNPKTGDYKFYGQRGIKISTEWNKFENFYRDMFLSYFQGLTIDRIDNNKGYSKENCKWSTIKEQCNNRRSNVLLTLNGKTKNVMEWSAELNVKADVIYKRIRRKMGDDKKILLTPIKI